jgi:hypothetical protein
VRDFSGGWRTPGSAGWRPEPSLPPRLSGHPASSRALLGSVLPQPLQGRTCLSPPGHCGRTACPAMCSRRCRTHPAFPCPYPHPSPMEPRPTTFEGKCHEFGGKSYKFDGKCHNSCCTNRFCAHTGFVGPTNCGGELLCLSQRIWCTQDLLAKQVTCWYNKSCVHTGFVGTTKDDIPEHFLVHHASYVFLVTNGGNRIAMAHGKPTWRGTACRSDRVAGKLTGREGAHGWWDSGPP